MQVVLFSRGLSQCVSVHTKLFLQMFLVYTGPGFLRPT